MYVVFWIFIDVLRYMYMHVRTCIYVYLACCAVRDATSRLPNGEGTRLDVSGSLKYCTSVYVRVTDDMCIL